MNRNWPILVALPVAVIAAPAVAKDYLTIAEAQRVLFPQAELFAPQQVVLNDAQLAKIKALAGVRQRDKKPKIWRAMKDGATQGWFFVDDVVGKHEFITYAAALSPDGHVLGIEILSYRETHGSEIRDPKWRAKFKGKTLADRFKLDVDVPNISGATLSCRNVTDGVKRLLALQKVLTQG